MKKTKELRLEIDKLVENIQNDRFALGEIAGAVKNYVKEREEDEAFDALDGVDIEIWRLQGFAQLIDVVELDLMRIQDRLQDTLKDLRA